MGLNELWNRVKRAARSRRTLAASGVFSAAVLVVCINVLVHRFYRRWDVTTAELFTLSAATKETLAKLDEPVDVLVFLGRGDPLSSSVEKLLVAYAAEAPVLAVRRVDPDDNPAEFLALQRKYELTEGKTEEGRLASDAVVVIARGGKSWFVTADDVVSVDREGGGVRPRLEQALTEGLRSVLSADRPVVCFTEGHGEATRDQPGAAGITELGYRLEKDNFEVRSVELGALGAQAEKPLTGCALVLMLAPTRPVSAAAAQALRRHVEAGGALGVAISPTFDAEGRIQETGLDPLTSVLGARFEPGLVIELDPKRVVAEGWGGEVFGAEPKPHEITRGLTGDPHVASHREHLIRLRFATALTKSTDSPAIELLSTSAQAGTLDELNRIADGTETPRDVARPARRELLLGLVAEVPGTGSKPARVALVGSASPFLSVAWRDPLWFDTRVFAENVLGWLTARPPIVSVPEKPELAAGLNLSQESYAEIVRYVLIYMPGTALLLALLILVRRRQKLPRRPGAAT